MRIAVLGMGAMGARMAARLVAAEGFEVTVWNRSPERTEPLREQGAAVATTPAEAATDADVVLAMLRDDDASREVWLGEHGAVAAMGAESVGLECSTITPAWARSLAAAAAERGVRLLDSPLSGSLPQAEAGSLVFFVGGDGAALEAARSVLDVVGGGVHHLGPSGTGAQVKMATNALLLTQVAALAEILTMLQGTGVEVAAAVEAIASTPVMSTSAAGAAKGILAGAFEPPAFALDLAVKDLTYAQDDVATRRTDPLPLIDSVSERYRSAAEAGWGEQNFSAVARLYSDDS